MSNSNIALLLTAVLVIVCGQIMFKFAAQSLDLTSGGTLLEKISTNKRSILIVLAAAILYGLSTIAWVIALRQIPLSVAFMFNALAFVIVPLAGYLLFNESLSRYFLLGLALIVVGLVLVTR